MAKRGPKHKYGSWMCDFILDVACVPGQYQAAMLWELGKKLSELNGTPPRPISPDTFARWRKEYPEFEEAWQESQIISQALIEKDLMSFATGKTRGNATGFALVLNAKFRTEYKPPESGNTTINNSLTVTELSSEELEYKLARVKESLTRSGKGYLLQDNSNVVDAEYVEVESEDDE